MTLHISGVMELGTSYIVTRLRVISDLQNNSILYWILTITSTLLTLCCATECQHV